jgi:hypothetical protein
MASRKQPRSATLRTVLERIDTFGANLEETRSLARDTRDRLGDLAVRVDSQSLLLEDMRSQNRATIEAVEVSRQALERRIDRLQQETSSRDALLEVAVRDLKVSVQQNSLDIRDLSGKVEALARLDERVASLERRLA